MGRSAYAIGEPKSMKLKDIRSTIRNYRSSLIPWWIMPNSVRNTSNQRNYASSRTQVAEYRNTTTHYIWTCLAFTRLSPVFPTGRPWVWVRPLARTSLIGEPVEYGASSKSSAGTTPEDSCRRHTGKDRLKPNFSPQSLQSRSQSTGSILPTPSVNLSDDNRIEWSTKEARTPDLACQKHIPKFCDADVYSRSPLVWDELDEFRPFTRTFINLRLDRQLRVNRMKHGGVRWRLCKLGRSSWNSCLPYQTC